MNPGGSVAPDGDCCMQWGKHGPPKDTGWVYKSGTDPVHLSAEAFVGELTAKLLD